MAALLPAVALGQTLSPLQRQPVPQYRPSAPRTATPLPIPGDGIATPETLRIRPRPTETIFDRCRAMPRTLPDKAIPPVCRPLR